MTQCECAQPWCAEKNNHPQADCPNQATERIESAAVRSFFCAICGPAQSLREKARRELRQWFNAQLERKPR